MLRLRQYVFLGRRPRVNRFYVSATRSAFFDVTLVCSILVLLAACSEPESSTNTVAVDQLPRIPIITVDHLSQEVREQFTELQQRLAATPIDGHYNSRFARLLHAYSLYAPAATMYKRCRLLRPSDLECVYLEALVQKQLGNVDQAVALLTALLEVKPNFPRASVVLADLYRQQGLAHLALPLFERAVSANRDDLEATYGLAMTLLAERKIERSRDLLQQLNSRDRQFGVVHSALATLSRQQGQLEDAAFHTAASARFSDIKIPFSDAVLWSVQDEQKGDKRHVREARAFLDSGRLQEAANAYLKATLANPDGASSHTNLIGIYGQLGNIAGAQRHFERARELNPSDVMPLVNLGTVQMKRGNFSDARDLFVQAVEIQPTHAEARTLGAYCTQLLGEPPLPDEFRRALKDDPTQSLAHYLLGRYLFDTQGCEVALPHFQASIRIESQRMPAFIPDLVKCLATVGEFESANDQLRVGRELAKHYKNASAMKALELAAQQLRQAQEERKGEGT